MARSLRGVAAIALVAACGCGSKAAPPAAPASRPAPSSQPENGAAEATPDAPPPGDDTPLTEADCAKLINHIIDIGMETQRQTRPADLVPEETKVAAIRDQMVHQMTPQCLQFDRPSWRCAMAATTAAEVTACVAGEPGQPDAAPAPGPAPQPAPQPTKKPAKKSAPARK